MISSMVDSEKSFLLLLITPLVIGYKKSLCLGSLTTKLTFPTNEILARRMQCELLRKLTNNTKGC